MKRVIKESVQEITKRYEEESLFLPECRKQMPSRDGVINILRKIRRIVFPGYFDDDNHSGVIPSYFVGEGLAEIYIELKKQLVAAFRYKVCGCEAENVEIRADMICLHFFEKLPKIQQQLLKDVEAGFNGDPAAKSREDIIYSYPGLFAIFVYRIAHEFYQADVPFIPRIMTEYAHSRTGIDINSGAQIGDYFFIDHGTGVVIGETTIIGNNVKLYQGVTLGALSTRKGQELSGVKRHPTLKDGVTVYSNSSILGGNTVIGENAIVGGNAFITTSVPANTRVSVKTPELTFGGAKSASEKNKKWDWDTEE